MDAEHIVLAALHGLIKDGHISAEVAAEAIDRYDLAAVAAVPVGSSA